MDISPDPGQTLWSQLILILVLTLVNAFFAASEMAIVSANKVKLKVLVQEGNKKAALVLEKLEDPNKLLSTIQVAITLAGFLASASAAVGMADDFYQAIEPYNIPYAYNLSVIAITIVLSFFTLVFGEIYPKRIALQHSEKLAMATIKPIIVVSKIFAPFNFVISGTVNLLLVITRQKTKMDEDEFSEEEVRSMLEVGQDTGVIKEEGKKMIDSIFAFDDKLAYEIMTPRTDVFSIDINDQTVEYIDELMELKFSRIPVYDDDSDNIIGILNIKDYLIKAREAGFDNVDIGPILRKPFFVPETKNIDSLFFDLQKTKQHIAILIDEYGGFSGIATMEDLIEEIVGDIDDEYDEEEPKIEKLSNTLFDIDGNVSINDVNEEIGLNLESENSETIGGFIIDILGEIPDEEDKSRWEIPFENLVFKIESVRDRRIEKITLRTNPAGESKVNEEDQSKGKEKQKAKEKQKQKEKEKANSKAKEERELKEKANSKAKITTKEKGDE